MSGGQQQPVSPQKLVSLYRQALAEGTSLDKLDEKVSRYLGRMQTVEKVEEHQVEDRVKDMNRRLPPIIRYGALGVPALFILVGLYLLGNAVFPLAAYFTKQVAFLQNDGMLTPIPAEEVLDVTPLVSAKTELADAEVGQAAGAGPVILDTELDYTNLSNWFEDDRSTTLAAEDSQTVYTIDIPEVDITQAEVKIGGTDLDTSLIAYPGTAMPGEAGAPVIFGHSVLRQFYNPSERNPRRYNSIFSYIMTLETGDEIYVTHQGVRYTYRVTEKTEVKPEDVYILSQNFDSKKLKLVTCVPEGTYLRRGVVTAELVAS